MSTKQVNYEEILSQTNGVETLINSLLTIVENINTECNNLASEGVWEGSLSSAFKAFSSRLNTYATKTVLNFKTTNEYKRTVVNGFINTENVNAGQYR